MVKQNIIGLQQHMAAINAMRAEGVRTGKVDGVFRRAAKPLIQSMRAMIPTRTHAAQYSRYPSRIHPPGTLKKSIQFKKSKQKMKVFYIGSISQGEGRDTFYNRFFITGSRGAVIDGGAAYIKGHWVRTRRRIGGFGPTPYVERSWGTAGVQALNLIDSGLDILATETWRR